MTLRPWPGRRHKTHLQNCLFFLATKATSQTKSRGSQLRSALSSGKDGTDPLRRREGQCHRQRPFHSKFHCCFLPRSSAVLRCAVSGWAGALYSSKQPVDLDSKATVRATHHRRHDQRTQLPRTIQLFESVRIALKARPRRIHLVLLDS